MKYAKISNSDQLICADDVTKKMMYRQFYCPSCNEPVHFRNWANASPYFAHNRVNEQCPLSEAGKWSFHPNNIESKSIITTPIKRTENDLFKTRRYLSSNYIPSLPDDFINPKNNSRIQDKYRYLTTGEIDTIAKTNPDMVYKMGIYYNHMTSLQDRVKSVFCFECSTKNGHKDACKALCYISSKMEPEYSCYLLSLAHYYCPEIAEPYYVNLLFTIGMDDLVFESISEDCHQWHSKTFQYVVMHYYQKGRPSEKPFRFYLKENNLPSLSEDHIVGEVTINNDYWQKTIEEIETIAKEDNSGIYKLGLYYSTFSIIRCKKMALFCFECAAANGNRKACNALFTLTRKMDPRTACYLLSIAYHNHSNSERLEYHYIKMLYTLDLGG